MTPLATCPRCGRIYLPRHGCPCAYTTTATVSMPTLHEVLEPDTDEARTIADMADEQRAFVAGLGDMADVELPSDGPCGGGCRCSSDGAPIVTCREDGCLAEAYRIEERH